MTALRQHVRARTDAVFLRALRSPWVRTHSGTSRSYGPPRDVTTIEDLEARGHRFHKAFSSYVPDWSSLVYRDGTPIDFEVDLATVFPRAGVLEIPDGRILSEHGWPVTARDEVVTNSAFVHEDRRFRSFEFDTRRRRVERLTGNVLNLTSAWCSNNYGHALLDSVGRLAIVLESGCEPATFDHVVIPSFRSAELDFVLDRVGVPIEKRRRIEPSTHIQADILSVTSFPGMPRCYPSWLAPFFRSLLPLAGTREGPRLWVSRSSGVRALRNHAEATRLAESLGYTAHTPAAGRNDLLAMAAADGIAGPHGAAMSSIVAAGTGTPFVELLPSGHRYPYFATLAASSGLRYSAVRCSSVSRDRNADYDVDLAELRDALSAT